MALILLILIIIGSLIVYITLGYVTFALIILFDIFNEDDEAEAFVLYLFSVLWIISIWFILAVGLGRFIRKKIIKKC